MYFNRKNPLKQGFFLWDEILFLNVRILNMLIVYTKTDCPWCVEVINFLTGKGILFEERNVFEEHRYFDELRAKSNQEKCPTLDLNGEILADAGVKEVEDFLITHKVI
jgi:glutaredoxin 3